MQHLLFNQMHMQYYLLGKKSTSYTSSLLVEKMLWMSRWIGLKQQELLYDHIELIGTHNKIETARRHGVHVFFEDKHDNAVEISEELDIPVLLFNTPYNQQAAPKGVIRVNNWIEANKWIEKEFSI